MRLIATVPLILIPIEFDGYHVMVQGAINHKPANLLIDTGASRSVFDQDGIRHYLHSVEFENNERLSTGLGTNTMPTMVTTIGSISIGDFEVRNYQAILIDLVHVHQSYQELDLPKIDGVIGGDILLKHKAVINYKNKTLKLYDNKR